MRQALMPQQNRGLADDKEMEIFANFVEEN